MNSRHLDTAHAATVSGIDYITERTDMFIIAQTYRSIFFGLMKQDVMITI